MKKELLLIILTSLCIALFFLLSAYASSNLPHNGSVDLPPDHEIKVLSFFKDNILVGGHFITREKFLQANAYMRMSSREAIILKSNQDRNSIGKIFSGKGDIVQFSIQEDGNIYALGQSFMENSLQKAYLLKTLDEGATWHLLAESPPGFLGIAFISSASGFAWSSDSIYSTKNGGNSWHKIEHPPLKLYNTSPSPVLGKNNILWVPGVSKLFGITLDGKTTSKTLPKSLEVKKIAIGPKNDTWLLGRFTSKNNKTNYLVKLTDSDTHDIVSELSDFYPWGLHIGENAIFVLGSEMKKMPPKKILLVSKDNGKTWRRNTFHELVKAPFAFDGNNNLWLYSSVNKIYKYTP